MFLTTFLSVFRSRNQFFDFDLGDALDDRSIGGTITTASLNAIVDIFSGRDLQIFTTGGEFYVPQTIGEPITPSNLTVKVATRNGIKPGVPVAGLDSGTLFIQRQGKQLNEMLFTDLEAAYTTANISLLSGHLLRRIPILDFLLPYPISVLKQNLRAYSQNEYLIWKRVKKSLQNPGIFKRIIKKASMRFVIFTNLYAVKIKWTIS